MKVELQTRQEISAASTEFERILFPKGTDFDTDQIDLLFEEYKIMAQSYDQLATRRQAVNGFFLSVNTFMLAGMGFIFKESLEIFVHEHRVASLLILAVALGAIGFVVDTNWSALLASYGQLLRNQTRVMQALERHLAAAPMSAQAASHSKELHSLSDLERNIALTFQVIFILCGVAAVVALTVLHPAPGP